MYTYNRLCILARSQSSRLGQLKQEQTIIMMTNLEKVKIDSTNKIVHIFMPDPRIRSYWHYRFCSPSNGK
jgi:hypothetical protein